MEAFKKLHARIKRDKPWGCHAGEYHQANGVKVLSIGFGIPKEDLHLFQDPRRKHPPKVICLPDESSTL